VFPGNPAVELWRRAAYANGLTGGIPAARDVKDTMVNITGFSSIFFGWKVVATAFTVAMFSWGIGFYGPSVFLNTLHQSRGWPVSLISTAITAHFVLSGVMAAYLADVHRRLGIARVTHAGTVASAAGILCWSLAAEPWHLFGAAMLTGAGWAVTSGAAINAMVSPWFDRHRAIALSHAFNGSSLGGVLIAPLWVTLIATIGFVGAASLIGVVMLVVLWPLIERYLTATPESLGVAADGDPISSAHSWTDKSGRPPVRVTTLLRDRRFATLSMAFALGLFAQIGLVTHLVTRLAPIFGAGNAAATISLITVCAVIGRLLLAALISDGDRRLVALGHFTMQAFGVACLALGTNVVMLLLGCILFGLPMGNLVSLPPLIAQKEFAQVDVPRVVALVTAANQVVFAFAPAILGVLREVSGGYTAPFLIVAAMQVAAAAVLILGRVH
jgi:MFS family permease